MAYPQPNSEDAVASGQSFFRLRTNLVSNGDIYESLVGGHGFALGPESDIANVRIGYFDSTVSPSLMQTASISPTRAFIGALAAHNEADASYQPTQRPGRILIWSENMFQPNLTAPGAGRLDYVTPVLDVIQYFSPVPSLIPARSDKAYQWERLPLTIADYFLLVPYYGRKYADITFQNFSAQAITFGVSGLTFTQTTLAVAETISAPAAVANTAAANVHVRASANGMFDMLALSFIGAGPADPTGPTPLQVIVSDNPL